MPLTHKGEEILANMEKEYGASKAKQVFFASRNKGTVTGVDAQEPDPMAGLAAAFDAMTLARAASQCQAYDSRRR